MNPSHLLNLLLGILLTHLSLVTSLPWKSPPKWKLPPLPDRRSENTDPITQDALLSRVRHLEAVVQKRLQEKEQLNRYRELERLLAKRIAEKEASQQLDPEQEVYNTKHDNSGKGYDTQNAHRFSSSSLASKAKPSDDPDIFTRQRLDALAAQLEEANKTAWDPVVELKEITRELEILVDKLDKERRE